MLSLGSFGLHVLLEVVASVYAIPLGVQFSRLGEYPHASHMLFIGCLFICHWLMGWQFNRFMEDAYASIMYYGMDNLVN